MNRRSGNSNYAVLSNSIRVSRLLSVILAAFVFALMPIATRGQTPATIDATLPPEFRPPGVTVDKAQLERVTRVSSGPGSIVVAPDSNPNRLALPTDGSAVKIERTELYEYSMELSNEGPKAIKAIAWDFIFEEPQTFFPLFRHSFANLQKIERGQKKTVRFTTHLGPPKVIINAARNDPYWDYRHRAQIQCLLFTDGSTWEQPDAVGKPCDRLKHWIERRKKSQSGVEDLPFNP